MATPAIPPTPTPVANFPTEIEFTLSFCIGIEDAEQLLYFQNADGNLKSAPIADLFDALADYWTVRTINNETPTEIHAALCAEAGV
jgi:hypothetical protein